MRSESNDLPSQIADEVSKRRTIRLKLLIVAGVMFVLAGVAFFSMELTVRASGIVLRHEEIIHFAPADGVLNTIDVSEGDSVGAGDFLCGLDDSEIRLGLLHKRRERQSLQFALSKNEAKLKEALVRPGDHELVNSPERLRLLSEISSIQQGYLNSLRELVEKKAVSQTKYQEQMVENLRVELDRSDAAERVRWIEGGILDMERGYLVLENERLMSEIKLLEEEIEIRERVSDSYRISATISGRITDLSFPYVGMAVKKGEIHIDDVPQSVLSMRWFRRQAAIVMQESMLLSGSVGDNIRFARPSASDWEVRNAAKMANAEEFINQMPQGYDTEVGEGGVQLSGGQRQRISIARAMLRNPKVLILDEATSALDYESESLVQEAIERLGEGRTVITIAHRLSTIKNADLIVVLRGGSIVEAGTFVTLAEKDGFFNEMLAAHAEPRVEVVG